MRQHSGPFSRAMALRLWLRRFALLLLLGLSASIVILGINRPQMFDRGRVMVADAAAPVLKALSHPVVAVGNLVRNFRDILDVHEANQRLREENAQLLQWRGVARRTEMENRQLRELLQYRGQQAQRFVTGRVIGVGGRFVRSVMLDVGGDRGVRKGQTAMAGDGLIGRVAMVGRNSSRVLLITDLNSRIPVLVEETNVRAILAGDNSYRPLLLFPPVGAALQPGQHIVTSGHGGAFPPGLAVGVIASVRDGAARVRPAVAIDRQEYVRLMSFGLEEGVLEADDITGEIP